MHATTRRTILKSALGVAALSLSRVPELRAHAAPEAIRDIGYYRYAIGDIRCTGLYDGIWKKGHADGFILNASVDQTKAALAEGGLSPTYVTIEFAQTLLETGGRTILIDPGTGGQWVPTAGAMLQNLASAGFRPRDIDTILISHFHPDHIFGLMSPETDAQIFPDAEIVVPAEEYAFWTDPGVFTKLPEAWHPLARRIQRTFPGWPNVRRVGSDVDLAPGVRSLAAPGHTTGHTAYHVSSGDEQLIVAGDVALTPALFVANPGWHAAYDADPRVAERTRRHLFDRVVADEIAIAGYHFGFPNVGRVRSDGAGYAFEPLPT